MMCKRMSLLYAGVSPQSSTLKKDGGSKRGRERERELTGKKKKMNCRNLHGRKDKGETPLVCVLLVTSNI